MVNNIDNAEPFKLFYMVHDGSLFHKFLCFVTMTPLWIIIYLLIVLLIYSKNQKRNLLLLIAFLSSIGLNKILKRIINQPRPYPHIYYGHGMPSDRAQFTCLWAGYMHQLLTHYHRFGWSKFHKSKHRNYILLIWIWTALVIYSRFALLFHDIYQLIAGGIIGIALSLIVYKIDTKIIMDTGTGYIPFSLHIN